jgi:hypothetical protein
MFAWSMVGGGVMLLIAPFTDKLVNVGTDYGCTEGYEAYDVKIVELVVIGYAGIIGDATDFVG